jgi:microcystin-dependent protein
MAILNKGQTFSDGEQVTSTKLNTAVDGATFAAGAVDDVSTQLSGGAIIVKDGGITLQKLATTLKDALYPIGSIYTNATNATNPATLIGFGTWAAFGAGKVPVGIDASDTDFDTAEETGGSKTHTLTTSQIPSHTHSVDPPSTTTSSNGSHSHTLNTTQDIFSGGGFALEDGSLTGTTNTSTVGNHTHTVNIPSFTSGSSGSGGSHNNLQPYIVVYMWQRTA